MLLICRFSFEIVENQRSSPIVIKYSSVSAIDKIVCYGGGGVGGIVFLSVYMCLCGRGC